MSDFRFPRAVAAWARAGSDDEFPGALTAELAPHLDDLPLCGDSGGFPEPGSVAVEIRRVEARNGRIAVGLGFAFRAAVPRACPGMQAEFEACARIVELLIDPATAAGRLVEAEAE